MGHSQNLTLPAVDWHEGPKNASKETLTALATHISDNQISKNNIKKVFFLGEGNPNSAFFKGKPICVYAVEVKETKPLSGNLQWLTQQDKDRLMENGNLPDLISRGSIGLLEAHLRESSLSRKLMHLYKYLQNLFRNLSSFVYKAQKSIPEESTQVFVPMPIKEYERQTGRLSQWHQKEDGTITREISKNGENRELYRVAICNGNLKLTEQPGSVVAPYYKDSFQNKVGLFEHDRGPSGISNGMEMPMGSWDLDENPIDTAKREFIEESGGFDIKSAHFLGKTTPDEKHFTTKHISDYAFEVDPTRAFGGQQDKSEGIKEKMKFYSQSDIDWLLDHGRIPNFVAVGALTGLDAHLRLEAAAAHKIAKKEKVFRKVNLRVKPLCGGFLDISKNKQQKNGFVLER